jgi:hypothetical protein
MLFTCGAPPGAVAITWMRCASDATLQASGLCSPDHQAGPLTGNHSSVALTFALALTKTRAMANIHINRAGQNLGIFSDDDVRSGLGSGRFTGADLAWREGMAAWQPLSQFSEFAADASSGATTTPTATPAAAAPIAATPPTSPISPITPTAPAAPGPVSIPAVRTEPLAIWSLVLSCVSIACCGPVLGIPGIVCGHLALSKIRLQPTLEGRGMAMAGLIIGYLVIAFWVVWVIFFGGLQLLQSFSHNG